MVNPNVLYIQSTPMTEPLLFGTTLASVALTARWLDHGAAAPPHLPGLAIVAACMTRYEAWPVSATLIAIAGLVLVRRGAPFGVALGACARLTLYPVVAILLFMANSRWTTGFWLISSGFYEPQNDALARPWLAWEQVRDGLERLSGTATVRLAYVGALLVAIAFVRSRSRATLALALSLSASAALPLYAYVQGHPFRIRYSLPLVIACAAITAAGLSTLPRYLRALASAAAVALTLYQGSPVDHSIPLIRESLRDTPQIAARATVTAYLHERYDGRLIMMSMGSLGHYMHDLSHIGLDVRDFLQEGNGEVWVAAMRHGPKGHVGWVAIEEQAEGGDSLYQRSRQWNAFLDGFERVAEGGGVALYRDRER
jgi:hypothetical protein